MLFWAYIKRIATKAFSVCLKREYRLLTVSLMDSTNISLPSSPSVTMPASSEGAACPVGTGSFNNRAAHRCTSQVNSLADGPDSDDFRPLAHSAALMREVVLAADARFAPSPLDPGKRIKHILRVSASHGLAHDPKLIAWIDRLGTDIAEDLRIDLEKQIRLAIFTKHGDSFTEVVRGVPRLGSNPVRAHLLRRMRFALRNSDEDMKRALKDKDLQAIKVHLSHLDLLFTMMGDFANILQQKTCSGPLSVMHYTNMTSYAKTIFTIDKKGTFLRDGSKKPEVLCYDSVVTPRALYQCGYNDPSMVKLINDVRAYWETELEIGVCITKSSAGALKSYLNNLGINRLYLPIAGSGYFARVMADEDMLVTCSDLSPPEKTFIQVKKAEISHGLRQFTTALSNLKQSISTTAITFDAPFPVFSGQGRYETAADLLAKVAGLWAAHGGRYLLVFSEVTDMKSLFSPDMLSTVSIRLEPVLPGFTPDIFLGLGNCVGNCGVYRVHKTSKPS